MVQHISNDNPVFPDPRIGEPCGLFALSKFINADFVLTGLKQGIFPWYSFKYGKYVEWFCPMCRFVFDVNEVVISHSMRNLINKNKYKVTFNQDFNRVIYNCSFSNWRFYMRYAWLGPQMIYIYKELNSMGYAKSVEVWDENGKLVGGLFGVVFDHCFIGDSMFSSASNTSKLALIYLADWLLQREIYMIDCEANNTHLASMGGKYITYERFLEVMNGKRLRP